MRKQNKKLYYLWIYGDGPYTSPVKSYMDASQCKICGSKIYWGETQKGKNLAFEVFTHGDCVNHFALCKKPPIREDQIKKLTEKIV